MASHEYGSIISISDHSSICECVGEKFDFMDGLAKGNDSEINSTASRVTRFSGNISIRNDP